MGSARGVEQQVAAIIQAGYRALSKQCHPDTGGSHEQMLALTEAKEHLEALLGSNGNGAGRKRGVPPKPPRASKQDYSPPDWVAIEDVFVIHASEKAILCDIAGEEFWIPLSQVHDDSEVYAQGDEGTLVITKWIAIKKGLR